jgi:hypothetical protein
MTEASRDTIRARDAAKAILDGRDPNADCSSILVTAEHAIAALLLTLFPDPDKAAAMFNEGLVPGVESRFSLYKSRQEKP